MSFPQTYLIQPKFKKSIEEIEEWTQSKEPFLTFRTEVFWRTGSYYIHVQDQEELDLLKRLCEQDLTLMLDDFQDFELIDTWDGVSEDYYVINDEGEYLDIEEDALASELFEAYQEDWSDALYERDFDSDGCQTNIYNGFTMELETE